MKCWYSQFQTHIEIISLLIVATLSHFSPLRGVMIHEWALVRQDQLISVSSGMLHGLVHRRYFHLAD